MPVATLDALTQAGWELIESRSDTAERDVLVAITGTRTRVAVNGAAGGDRSRILHRAFHGTALFPLTLKSNTDAASFNRSLKGHKANFDAKPDALILDDFEAWSNAALAEVGAWAVRKGSPIYITLDCGDVALEGEKLKEKLSFL